MLGEHHEESRVVARPDGPDAAGCVRCARANKEITLLSPNPIEATIQQAHSGSPSAKDRHRHARRSTLDGAGVSTRKTMAERAGARCRGSCSHRFRKRSRRATSIRNSATVVGRLRLAIGVRKGAPKPDISTPDAVRRMLRNANVHRLRGHPEQGSVGGAVLLTLDKLGITPGVETEDQVGADRRRRAGRGGEGRVTKDRVRPLSQRHAQSRVGCRRCAAARGIDTRGHYRVSIHERERSQSGASAVGLPLVTGGCDRLREREDLLRCGDRRAMGWRAALLLRLCSERCGGNGLCIGRTGLYRRLRPAHGASHIVLGSSSL